METESQEEDIELLSLESILQKIRIKAIQLAEYASYAEDNGCVSCNRQAIKDSCESIFELQRLYENTLQENSITTIVTTEGM